MLLSCCSFGPSESIPFGVYLRERKFAKYFSRETACAITAMGRLLDKSPLPRTVPVYYCMGVVEHESYGLDSIASASAGADGMFSQKLFVEHGFSEVPPLNQFKILYNMPLSFISIVFGFNADNAALYGRADSLLMQARCSVSWPVLLGAGKAYPDGSVSAGFMLAEEKDLALLEGRGREIEAVELLLSLEREHA